MKEIHPELLFQDIGDTEVQYLKYGGDGPTVILLHATGFSPWLWHPISLALADHYNVIAPYFCDHRESDPNKGGLNWTILAEDLCKLCDALDIREPFLAGHSMGATVMTLANGLHGDVAKKMVLIEPIFLPHDFYNISLKVEDHPLASKSIKRKNHWQDKDEVLTYFKSKSFFQSWDERVLELYIKYGIMEKDSGGFELTCSPQREASLFMGGGVYDPWPVLPKITCPVLVVEGEMSENRSWIDLKKAASLFEKGTYHMVNGAGHLIPMEQPMEIFNILDHFFKD
ncbi:MAG: alpha/beta hydrolase [Proteobacteria bacterium]|nr:alpha/beta hydrolase [Pseudomonadota bacterium]